ncbi:IPT/TIG domain protein [Luteitalea pratensis]|uniref:IPT/TIG domain protein n=1 Tax=Luteitalea pratensis TaxID=1855912 RepID=A0A143PQ28_LUTPR|nr:GDSL-type esterase/lipase family protein [Luteitalea pratensis]AMY09924.1 IPT/TIG domain protein [Luteitalea pratensis]
MSLRSTHVLRLFCVLSCLLFTPALVWAQDTSRWFLAEGASNAVLEEEILVGNPGAYDLTVTVTLLPDPSAQLAPGTTLSRAFPLQATGRLTVRVAQAFPGLNGAASATVSAVRAGTSTPENIVVERSMYFPDGTRAGGHNASGVTATAQRWILAEGASGMFSTFILVANPNATTVSVRIQYLKSTGDIVTFERTLPANSRTTFWPQVEYPAQLGSAEFSTVVESTEPGKLIVAERAMYFDPSPTGSGFQRSGHDAVGVPEASYEWYFAEGYTGGNAQTAFETFLLLANTNGAATTASVTYQLDSGQTVTRDYALAPNQRLTVWVDQEGRSFDARLKAASFGMTVRATQPIVAERSMYWGTPSAADPTTPTLPWREGHATAGSPVLASRWAFAEGREGEDGSVRPYSTFFLLSNPSASAVNVKATFFTEDGGGVTTTRTIAAGGRANIWTAESALGALANRRFAVAIESTNGGTFVAERAMYAFSDFRAGHVNMGTPWPGVIAAPAHPPATVTITGISPAQVRLSGGEPITISGTGFSIDSEVTLDGIPMTVTSATSTTITAITPVRTATTGFGSVGPSRVRVTASGFTTVAGTIQRVFRVLAIGDSFTEGQLVERIPIPPPPPTPTNPTPVSPGFTQTYSFANPPYPEALEGVLHTDAQYGATADVDNAGFSGECASIAGCSGNPTRGADRIGPLVTARKYDVVIILEGFNDLNAGGSLSGAITALRSMGTTARASGATVVMGRIQVMRSDMLDAIRTMALEEMFTRVDFGASVEIGTDDVHPTQDGYETMAGIVYGVIKGTIK